MEPIPPSTQQTRKRFWIGWSFAFAATGLIVVLAALPPFVPSAARLFLMQVFSPVCHQMPARSPMVDGVAFAVCHRCFGIYSGLPLAALFFLLVPASGVFLNRHARVLLLLSLAPLAIDWGVDFLGLWSNTPASRLLTGGVFGLAAGLFLTRALVQSADPAPRAVPAPSSAHAEVSGR